MMFEKTKDGGLKLELEAAEVEIFRYLVERAAFIDTPPEKQDAILSMADQILTNWGVSDGSSSP